MPCYDPRSDEPKVVYRTTKKDEKTISDLQDYNSKLEAALCALISELIENDLADKIIPKASRKGLIDLVGFWNAHHKDDRTRLASELHKFSIHEQKILKDILNKQ